MMSPAGGLHGRIAGRICKLLANHVDDLDLGCVFAAKTGFLIGTNPDTVRAPDAAFVGQQKMEALRDDSGFLPFAPDLAVEVVSPNDSFSGVEEKAFNWLDSGCRLVLIVEPESKTVHAYRSRLDIRVIDASGTLEAGDVVGDWNLPIAEIFS